MSPAASYSLNHARSMLDASLPAVKNIEPRLRIAHVYQEAAILFSEPRAAQLHIYQTIRGLQHAGHEVKLLALQGRQVLCTPELEVFKNHNLPPSYFARLGLSNTRPFKVVESGIRRLQSTFHLPYLALFDSYRVFEAACLNVTGADLLYERFNLLSLGGVWASQRLGIPLVLEVNADLLAQRRYKGVPERGLRRAFAIWATRAAFRAAAKIVCISGSLKEHLQLKWKIDENRLTVLPCAVDTEAFEPNQNTEQARRSLGLTDEPVIVWVGGFFPWHDLALLVQSFARVVVRHPNARLVLVGDGVLRPAVQQQVQKNGLQRSVIMTGPMPHAQVPALLSMADLAVVPSAPVSVSSGGTGTPLKLFEYMAAGKAIVATALHHATEVLQHNQTGLLVEAGNVDRFAEAMLMLLTNPTERVRLGRNARQRAIDFYSWDQYTQRLEDICRGVVSHAPPRSAAR